MSIDVVEGQLTLLPSSWRPSLSSCGDARVVRSLQFVECDMYYILCTHLCSRSYEPILHIHGYPLRNVLRPPGSILILQKRRERSYVVIQRSTALNLKIPEWNWARRRNGPPMCSTSRCQNEADMSYYGGNSENYVVQVFVIEAVVWSAWCIQMVWWKWSRRKCCGQPKWYRNAKQTP